MVMLQEPPRKANVLLERHQREALDAKEPYVALVTGLGGGKTFFGARWIAGRSARFPKSIHLATGNSYPQIRDIIIPEFHRAFDELRWDFTFSKSDLEFRFRWGSLIRVRSTENYNLLRGPEYGSWWADEVRDASKEATDVVFGRLRCKHVDKPRYLWTTTPNGLDFIYDRHVKAGDPDCRLIQAESSANRHLRRGYIDAMRTRLDAQTAKQEVGGQFVLLGTGAVFRAFSRDNVREGLYDPSAPLFLGADFNINPMALTVYQWHRDRARPDDPAFGEVHVLDEAHCPNSTVGEAVAHLAPKWARHRAGWDVWPDPAGRARNHAGFTDHQLLMQALEIHGFTGVNIHRGSPGWPLVKDAANSVNGMLRNDFGVRRLFIDPQCTELIADLERCKWDKSGAGIDKNDRARTHASDSLKYGIHGTFAPRASRGAPFKEAHAA